MSGSVPSELPEGRSQEETTGPAVIQAPTGALVAAVASMLPDSVFRDDRLSSTPLANSLHDPMNVVPYRGGYLIGWQSQSGLLPQQLGYKLRSRVVVDRVAFQQTGTLPRDTWANEVGLLLSTDAPDQGFYVAGRWALPQTLDPQEFTFTETPARYVRVCLYSNYGNKESVSLGAFALGVTPPPEQIQTQSNPLLPPRR